MITTKLINGRLFALKDLTEPYHKQGKGFTQKRERPNFVDGLALCGVGRKGETAEELINRIKNK